MNEDIIKGKWKQLKGKTQAKWGELTNDELDVAEGDATYLAGKIQSRYGVTKDEAEKQVSEYRDSLHKDYPDFK